MRRNDKKMKILSFLIIVSLSVFSFIFIKLVNAKLVTFDSVVEKFNVKMDRPQQKPNLNFLLSICNTEEIASRLRKMLMEQYLYYTKFNPVLKKMSEHLRVDGKNRCQYFIEEIHVKF